MWEAESVARAKFSIFFPHFVEGPGMFLQEGGYGEDMGSELGLGTQEGN